jgi:hypothetical protein
MMNSQKQDQPVELSDEDLERFSILFYDLLNSPSTENMNKRKEWIEELTEISIS